MSEAVDGGPRFARLRRRLARRLWPAAFAAPPPAAPPAFAGDGMTTDHNSDFLRDPRFQKAYAAGKATGSWWDHDLQWRAYVICWAALHGKGLKGDYVECGVHRGGYSRMLAEYVDLGSMPGKKLYLVDTYSGMPDRFVDEERRKAGEDFYGECYDDVLKTFAPYPNAIVVRGVVPEILDEVNPDRICYLSIDLNSAEPSIAAAEHFWPRMTAGAAMVLDDYGFTHFKDQKIAFDEFGRRIGTPILSLPTGQGLLIKP